MPAHRVPLADRFWRGVQKGENTDSCWPWIGALKPGPYQGYGLLSSGTPDYRQLKAHRVAYEIIVGPISENCEIDHLCRNHACVNPHHLEAVPHRVNVLRGTSPMARHARKTECVHGHPFTEENTFLRRSARQTWRRCRICYRAENNAYRARKART